MQLIGEDLHLSYDDVSIFEGLRCAFEIGTSTAVVGPSGTGKSSLLAMLGGLLAPTRGAVMVRAATGDRAVADHVAWVHQASTALRNRRVDANVQLGFLARGVGGRAARLGARQLLEEIGLGHRMAAKARKLSGGELQRVAIARALAVQASFIIADEPTGNLDRANGELVVELLVDKAIANGQGVIIATHDRSVADRCDTTIDLSVAQQGAVA